MTVHILAPYGLLCDRVPEPHHEVIPYAKTGDIKKVTCKQCLEQVLHFSECENCNQQSRAEGDKALVSGEGTAQLYLTSCVVHGGAVRSIEELRAHHPVKALLKEVLNSNEYKALIQKSPPKPEPDFLSDSKTKEAQPMQKHSPTKAPNAEARPVVDVDVQRSGSAIILPEGLDYADAISAIERRRVEENTSVDVSFSFDMTPPEGAIAMMRTLRERYGFVSVQGTPGFFGGPPQYISVETAPGVFEEIAWGRFIIPGLKGHLEPSIEWRNDSPYFSLSGSVLGKNKVVVKELAEQIRQRSDSLYKGQAVKVSFPKPRPGMSLTDFLPKFMDLPTDLSDESLIFPREIEDLIATTLFTPIEYTDMTRTDGIPLKRGILLEGPFGVGKTLTALLTAKKCRENGWTFLYLTDVNQLPRALVFARQYGKCVIFAEDIDQILKEDDGRDAKVDGILNEADGIDSKNSEVIIVLTTNNVDRITKAMLRPGRIDTVIPVPPASAESAQRLVRLYAKERLAENQDLTEVGDSLKGLIPAVIREVVERSKLGAIRRAGKNGEVVPRIHASDILVAARSMSRHVQLLEVPKEDNREPIEKAAEVLGNLVASALTPAPKTNGKSTNSMVSAATPAAE